MTLGCLVVVVIVITYLGPHEVGECLSGRHPRLCAAVQQAYDSRQEGRRVGGEREKGRDGASRCVSE